MKRFLPARGYIEIEPLKDNGIFPDDERKFFEKGRVIQTQALDYKKGDIIFFRPHGCFELAEHDGVARYVVRNDPEFLLGNITDE